MALLPWRKGIVIKIDDHTHNTRRFWIQVPDCTDFDFIPGQFVTLDLPIHEKPTKRMRSYSIASWPDGSNIFELLIVQAEGGSGTTYLFNEISIGSEITFRGALGVFNLPPVLDKELLLICTGTGIAPFRSMVQHIQLKGIQHKGIHLIFGCRNKADLLYYEELTSLETSMPGFHFYPTLSREHWQGHNGYVHDVYKKICVSRPEAYFFLCGWKNMITEAKETILEMGYAKNDIHQELYG